MGGGFSRELSKGPVPCVGRGVPSPFLDPAGHLHPAISSPLPPRGSNTCVRSAGTWRTWRQTGRTLHPDPTTAKIPLFSLRKGVPLSAWENMGRPPGHGFSPSLGWLFSCLDLAAHAHSVSPTSSLPRVTCPTLELSDHLHRVPRHLSGKRKPTLPPRGPRDFHGPHFPAALPAPHRQCAQERLGDRGPGSGIFQGAL